MTTQRLTYRIAPLAAALLVATTLAACNRHDSDDTASTTAANAPADTTGAGTTAPSAAASAPAAANDNTAMADTSGTTADNMGNPATTSADASAMAGEMSGPITATQFYQEALSGGQKEIDASKMAEKSSNAEVKALAKTILADHTALGDKVKAAAGANPPTPASPDLSALTGKTGADLDKAYVDLIVSDHQKDIPMFENASKNADTDTAKQLATAALPKLHKHLDMAQKVQSSLK